MPDNLTDLEQQIREFGATCYRAGVAFGRSGLTKDAIPSPPFALVRVVDAAKDLRDVLARGDLVHGSPEALRELFEALGWFEQIEGLPYEVEDAARDPLRSLGL